MRLRFAVFVAIVGILAISCGGGTTPTASTAPTATVAASAAATSSGAPADKPLACCKKVVAAYSNISADDWVMWYAFEKGIFKER